MSRMPASPRIGEVSSPASWRRRSPTRCGTSSCPTRRLTTDESSPYWLVPFQNYKTMCPYLVGSYEQVAEELARYITAGYRTVILDVPPSEDELTHTFAAFAAAMEATKGSALDIPAEPGVGCQSSFHPNAQSPRVGDPGLARFARLGPLCEPQRVQDSHPGPHSGPVR